MVSKAPDYGILNFTRCFHKILFIRISKLMGGGKSFLIIPLITPPYRYLRGQSHNVLALRFVIVKVHTALTELINTSLEMLQIVQLN